MMGKQNGQIQMLILDIDSMIPQDHLLRQIKEELLALGVISISELGSPCKAKKLMVIWKYKNERKSR